MATDYFDGLLALRNGGASSATTKPSVAMPVVPAIGGAQEVAAFRQLAAIPQKKPYTVAELQAMDVPTGSTTGSDAIAGVMALGDVMGAASRTIATAVRPVEALAALPSRRIAESRAAFERMKALGDKTLVDAGLDPTASDAAFADIEAAAGRATRRVVLPGGASVWDVASNFKDGYRNFSLLAGGQGVGVDRPVAAAWFAGVIAATVAEGPVSDLAALAMLKNLSKTATSPIVRDASTSALKLFGQGELQPVWRQVAGNAALGGATTTAMLAASGESLGEAATTGAAATALGGVLGAPVVAARLRAAAPAAASLGDEARSLVAPPAEYLRAGQVEADEVISLRNFAGKLQSADPTRSKLLYNVVLKAGKGEALDASEADALRVVRDIDARERFNASRAAVPEASATPLTDEAIASRGQVVYRSMFGVGGSAPGAGAPSATAAAELTPELKAKADFYVRKPQPKTTWETFTDALRAGRESLGRTFVFEYDVRKFDSFQGVAGLNHTDDINVLNIQRQRNTRTAENMLHEILEPLKGFSGKDVADQFGRLEDLIIWRDITESLERGIPTGNLTLEEAEAILEHHTSRSSLEVLDAASRYKATTNKIRDEMIADGILPEGGGFDSYFPHRIVDDLAKIDYDITGVPEWGRKAHPSTVYVRGKALELPGGPIRREGSDRPIEGDLIGVSFRAFRTYLNDKATREFLNRSIEAFGQKPELFVDDMVEEYGEHVAGAITRDLERSGRATLPDGQKVKLFDPTPRRMFQAHVIADEMFKAMTEGAQAVDIKVVRGLLAARGRQYVMPAELADRYAKWWERDPHPWTLGRKLTGEWQRNTIFFGLMQFVSNNVLGDAFNLLRSNPAAYVQMKRGTISSPMLTGMRAVFNEYRLPLASPQQMLGALAGGIGGLSLDEAIVDDPDALNRISAVLAGAGLGYTLGSRGVRIFGKQLLPDLMGTAKHNPMLANYYEAADKLGAINSGFYAVDVQDVPRSVFGTNSAELPGYMRGTKLRAFDTLLTGLTGKVHGAPWSRMGGALDALETLNRERENLGRLASYIQQVEDGIAPELAAKRASAALVDYNRLTSFERKYLRGFFLPFYTFSKQNSINWTKAMVGNDVGGKGKVALLALGGIAAFDISAQMWNEKYFPEIEDALPAKMRKRFHIIAGDPSSGEVYRDKHGRPVVIGWEQPYEMALEMFGLARPGIIISELFGHDLGPDASLIGRVKDTEDFNRLPSALKAPLHGIKNKAFNLLTPFLRVPIEVAANEKFYFGTPLVPDRYLGTPVEKERVHQHIASSFFRQYREFGKARHDIEAGRFNLGTSPIVGLPVFTLSDRSIRGGIHAAMDRFEQRHKNNVAEQMKQVEDLIYNRQELSVPGPDEMANVEKIAGTVMEPDDRARLYRFYAERSAKTDIVRRFSTMPMADRARLLEEIKGTWLEEALLYYLYGGNDIMKDAGVMENNAVPGRQP